ncbi:BEACH domain-containing protein B isoform X1 [Tanacetum coccineum]
MKKVLHFFGEFLVEGTWGWSVFRDIQASGSSESNKADNIGTQKQKFIKWPVDLVSTSDGEASDDINAVVGNLLQKQSENIKRHKRRDLSKGLNPPPHKLKPGKAFPFQEVGVATQDKDCPLWTRYLLRYTAIEVYFNDSAALNFASNKEAKDVGSLIVATRNELVFPKGYRDKAGVISFVDRRVSIELAETAKESWRRRDITHFEYLMILNTLAGRSYNDLTQYPVFPWVLEDYTSDVLDFNKLSIFRDLSKPVGSKTDLNQPASHTTGASKHGEHISNCLSNTSDVKELVPQFYYMPEFHVNSNSYHLGVKQDGEPLNDVGFPPWPSVMFLCVCMCLFLIVATRNELVFPKGYRDKAGVISFVDRRVSIELAETAKESWRRRDITHFKYLMILNTLAGRSYNDLTQYPVFPWVLEDYTSDVLDFNKSSIFRDLSKPVGSKTVFEVILQDLNQPASHTTGASKHGEHISNCLSNTSDVKELVPQFYYMPEFHVNSNSYHLGVKQDGEPLNDVGFPPWPRLFACRLCCADFAKYLLDNDSRLPSLSCIIETYELSLVALLRNKLILIFLS